MGSRDYDKVLECGCMISSDKGGGVIPCYAEEGFIGNENDRRAMDLCDKSWKEWKDSDEYETHLKEVREKNP